MRLTILGSGTVAPTGDRAASGYWLEAPGVRLLLDCGAGTLQRAATFGVPWAEVTHVAISHFHVDHWGELPHLLFALRWGTLPPRATHYFINLVDENNFLVSYPDLPAGRSREETRIEPSAAALAVD